MTPDHETDTLDGLIARWRRSVAPDGGYNSQETTSASYAVVRLNCADELAPILAGLRKLRNELDKDANTAIEVSKLQNAYKAQCEALASTLRIVIGKLDALLGQPATADQTGR